MKKYFPVLDLLFVLLFVGIGRTSHQHGVTLSGMVSTTWPFAVGLLVAWLTTLWRRRAGDAPSDGALIVLLTVIVGMVLRVVSHQGTAVAFVIVALVFLGLFLVGWRAVFRFVARRRALSR
jgi:FtsH-binding integral membrane protein